MGTDLGNREGICQTVKNATRLTTYISSDGEPLAKLTEPGINRKEGFCKTRWYSTVDMLESLKLFRSEAINYSVSTKKRDKTKNIEFLKILKNEEF